jgi:hypothetical protein
MEILGFELASRFVWGWFLILSLISRKETSERFLKISFWVIFGVSLTMLLIVYRMPSPPVSKNFLYGECAFYILGHALYSFTIKRFFRILGWCLVLSTPFLTTRLIDSSSILGYILSAGVLGGAFMGQFLGHWYLNVPGMNIFELKKVTWIFLGSVIFKTIENLVNFYIQSSRIKEGGGFFDDMGRPLGLDVSETQSLMNLNLENSVLGLRGDTWLGLGTYGVLVYSMRILWGLLAPLVLGFMVKKTVSIRSTQSATGILYAVCVLVLLGEGAALFMIFNLGWNV